MRLPIILLTSFLSALVIADASKAATTMPKMPAVLARIAQCETRTNWRHSTRDYATAFGIYRGAWADYRRYAPGAPVRPEDATPAQQVAVALAIVQRVGYRAWACYRKYAWVRG